jgi:hypothetical protein
VAELENLYSLGKISVLNKNFSFAPKNFNFEPKKSQFCPELTPKNLKFSLN